MSHWARRSQVTPEARRDEPDDNPQVSSNSRYCDDVWDFSDENRNPAIGRSDKRICWSFALPGGLFTDARFRSLLTASKQFVYALRWRPIDTPSYSPASLRNLFRSLKGFIAHLVGYSNPVLRFKDVLPHHCADYLLKLSSSDARTWRWRCTRIQILQMLFRYRGVMQDGLVIDPLNGDSIVAIVGKNATPTGSKTEIIPEHILGTLVRASLQYVDQFSEYLLDCADELENIRGNAAPNQFPYLGTRHLRRHALAPYPLAGSRLGMGVRSLRRLSTELCHLQTACFVLIAFATGMRLSELLSLREGCCEVVAEPGQPDLTWVHSRVFKMQGVPDGREAKWLGGPLCGRAVHVLERLGKETRRRAEVSFLWMPIPAVHGRHSTREPLSEPTILRRLSDFVAMLGLKNSTERAFHLHPHMFRRTFARYVVRHDTTNLLALKEHFKHISLSMTDHYVGDDLELWMLLEEETERVSFESFDKALRADQLAGPGGARLKKKVDQAISEGRLRKDFRGEAGAHLRRRMIVELVEAGQRVYPCAASNYCWFHDGSALCTSGDRPVLRRCNPGACSNSIIMLEHRPHWERVKDECEVLMAHKPQAEPYQKALRDIHAVSSTILRSLNEGLG
ncbi:MAG: site-specific integrase [Bryobacterales bacterium]|nr:site-specific integrase [Bryobacterales bacterium]MEB2363622.1 site-specific integrase [Bryobacterales bacterium]